jgi:MFS family permease
MSDIITPSDVLPKSVFIPLLIGGVLLAACYGSTFMLADHLKLQGLDPTLAGSAISAGILVTLVSTIFAGRLATRIGLLKSISISAMLMALAMMSFSAAPIVSNAIFVGGLFLGAGWAVFYILAPLIIINMVTSSVRVKYLTFLSGAQMLGLGLSVPAGNLLTESGVTYSEIYVGLGVLSLISAVIFFQVPEKNNPNNNTTSYSLTLADSAKIIGNLTVFPAMIIGLLACIFSGLATFQSLYAEPRGLSPATFFLIFTFVTVVLRFGVASQIAKFPIYGLSIGLILITITSLSLFVINEGNVQLYMLASAIFAVGYGLSYSTLNAIGVNIAETKGLPISAASQIFTLFYFVGIFGFPFIAGQIIAVASVNAMLITMLGVNICALMIGVYLRVKST